MAQLFSSYYSDTKYSITFCAKWGHLSVSPQLPPPLQHSHTSQEGPFCHPLFLCHHHRHLQLVIYHLFFLGLS